MKVLVTGGAGFIGSNLVDALVGASFVNDVVVIDDLSTGLRENLREDVPFVEASILDTDALTRAAEGCDAVVHLAALGSVPRSVQNPMATHEANATGSLKVLEAARDNDAHILLASSSSVYGANPTLPKVETLQTQPMSPYAVSKLATEQYAMAFAKCYDLDVLPFRFFNVFGPRQMPGHVYAAVIPVFVDLGLRGQPLTVNGDGQQSRDFTYVGTVVETLVQALRGRVTSSPTNLAFGTRTTLNALIEMLGDQLSADLQVETRPDRAGDVKHSQADNQQLLSLFPGLAATPLQKGLASTVEWMRTRRDPPGVRN